MGWVWKQDHAWRGAYRDEAGKQHTKSFKRQVDAKRWIATEEAKVVRGDWVNPAAGKVTFAAFYADWSPRQVWLSSTRENADLAVAGTTFAQMPLRSIRRSHVEAWVKQLTREPRTHNDRHQVHHHPWCLPCRGRGSPHTERPDVRSRAAPQAEG